MTSFDVLIVGGGVIGMMTARELANGGAKVLVVDKGNLASEASWAGGGIVSPLYPWRYNDAITALASWSQSSYVRLSQELLEETGIDPELRQKGLLMLAVADERNALEWAKRCQRPMVQVAADFIYQLEANLPAGLEQALWMPEVSSIRNPRLGQSLQRSLELHPNIELKLNCPVLAVNRGECRVESVSTADGDLTAGHYLLSAGAWSGGIAEAADVQLPVQPVKGQMLLFKAEPGLLDRVVLQNGRYLIPRNDGRILVGSTLEFEGFNKRTTEEAYKSLYESAIRIMPKLEQYPVEVHWSGLRPGSPGGIPFIGQVPGVDNLYINAGHFRNGLVLAPASCHLVADLILGRQPMIDEQPYQLKAPRPENLI
ncbi:glycine oxidase ThiO [Motiliproteus sp. MSK22-1]|uniref:glycine oxidase ThiO n=1 Tax=Motiliproteus sp. MSK22-1 TaxID=1897630 RepID=UPI00097866E3|nr:glycine oxidase ThiO [Motiliproteus sp. MSK22-1]OMH28398.1 glycine oxidase ThiO [Motiliproteus sp. MSK22-1]